MQQTQQERAEVRWEVQKAEDHIGHIGCVVVDQCGNRLTQIISPETANMIAAAPSTYEALWALLRSLEGGNIGWDAETIAAIAQGEAAIKKAEGRS